MSNLSDIVQELKKKKSNLEKENQSLHDIIESYRSNEAVVMLSNKKAKDDFKYCDNKLIKTEKELKFCNEYKLDLIKRTNELLSGKDNQIKKDFKTFLKLINSMFEDYEKVGSFRIPKRECEQKIQPLQQSLHIEPLQPQAQQMSLDIFEGDWELYDSSNILYAELQIDSNGYLKFKDILDDELEEHIYIADKYDAKIRFSISFNRYILECYRKNTKGDIKSIDYIIIIDFNKENEKIIKLYEKDSNEVKFILNYISKHKIKNKDYIKKWAIYDINGNETRYYFNVKKDGVAESNFNFSFKKIILDDEKNQLIFYKNIKDEYSNDITEIKRLYLEYKNNILNVYDIISPSGYLIGATKKLVFSLRNQILDEKNKNVYDNLSIKLWHLYYVTYTEESLGPSEYKIKEEKETLNFTKYTIKIKDRNILLNQKISSSDKEKLSIFEKYPLLDIKSSCIEIEEKTKDNYFNIKIVKIPIKLIDNEIVIYNPETFSKFSVFKDNKKMFILKSYEIEKGSFDIQFFTKKRWSIFVNDDKKYMLYLKGDPIPDSYKYKVDTISILDEVTKKVIEEKKTKKPINTIIIEENGDIKISSDIQVRFDSGKFTNDTFNIIVKDREIILPIKKEDTDKYSLITVYKSRFSSYNPSLLIDDKSKKENKNEPEAFFRLLYTK
jgi:hypothetical protein